MNAAKQFEEIVLNCNNSQIGEYSFANSSNYEMALQSKTHFLQEKGISGGDCEEVIRWAIGYGKHLGEIQTTLIFSLEKLKIEIGSMNKLSHKIDTHMDQIAEADIDELANIFPEILDTLKQAGK